LPNIRNEYASAHQLACAYVHSTVRAVQKTHPDLVKQIEEQTLFLDETYSVVHLAQRMWHVANEINSLVKCDNCTNSVKWDTTLKGYRHFCSAACCNTYTGSDVSGSVEDLKLLSTEEVRTLRRTDNKLYNLLSLETKFLPSSAAPAQRLWHVKNSTSVSQCEQCGSATKWDGDTYRPFCSSACSASSDRVRSRYKTTSLAKYGCDHPNQHSIIDSIQLLADKQWLLSQHITEKKPLRQIAEELGVDNTTVTNYAKEHAITVQRFAGSQEEREILATVAELCQDEVRTNDRQLIHPLELDILIPRHSLAIEVCGGYWHSDRFKSKTYHKEKWNKCNDLGIQLLTIYDVEWNNKKNIVRSIIANKLGVTPNKINARSCTIQQPNVVEQREFLNANHIQGFVHSTYCFSLNYNGQTVAMLCFLKQGNIYQLVRFCTLLKHNVRGGFSKLLSHARAIIHSDIVTFADLRWSDGKLYEKAFDRVGVIAPTYNYIRYTGSEGEMFHRSSFRRSKLEKIIPRYDPNLTEFEN